MERALSQSHFSLTFHYPYPPPKHSFVFSGKYRIPPSRLGHHDLRSKLAYCHVTSLLGNKLYYFCILFTLPSTSLVTEVSSRRNTSENNLSTLLSVIQDMQLTQMTTWGRYCGLEGSSMIRTLEDVHLAFTCLCECASLMHVHIHIFIWICCIVMVFLS